MAQRWTQRPPGSTWGDWGDDDELGRINLLTSEKVLAGVREVVYGRSLPLATGVLQIVPATTGVQAGVIGAATMVIQHALTADRVDLAIAQQSAS